MLIALPSYAQLPDWEVDDNPLHEALRANGANLACPAWDDPEFDWAACDACVIRTTWDYHLRLDEFVAWAERVDRLTLLLNPLEILQWNTHKTYLRDLEQRGVLTIPTIWLDRGDAPEVGPLLDERGWRAAFLKPAVGATSRATLRFDATEAGIAQADEHLRGLLAQETMLLQPYLRRVESAGELSAIFIDGQFSHAVRKIPLPGDYRVQDDFGAKDQSTDLSESQLAIAQQCIEAANTSNMALLYARVDLLEDDTGTLRVNELELVEPSLFFRHGPGAADMLAGAICKRVRQS